MSEYKRLTTKDEEGNWQVWEDDYSHPFEALQVAIDRLAELEDKIEQGTMIEIPTQEFVFHISKSKNGNYVVRKISKYYYMSVYACADGIMNKWFSTREEAEKRLKELQG
jgi:hypothetical protein